MKAKNTTQARAQDPSNSSAGGYWLLKSEPDCFSFDDLWRCSGRRTGWSGVRNYQARNYLRDEMRIGDLVLFYHSSVEPPGVAGLARVASAAEADPTQFDPADEHFDAKARAGAPTWVQVQVQALRKLPSFVPLAALRASPDLAGMKLLEPGSRLSVLPVRAAEWEVVVRLGGLDPLEFRSGKRAGPA